MTNAAEPALRVRSLGHSYPGDPPVAALDGVDLEAARGAFVSLLGPSGCGKSTILQVLAGLLVPSRGEAAAGGTSTIGEPALTAYMPQRDLLLPWRRVEGNATLGAEVAGVARQEARDASARAVRPLRAGGVRTLVAGPALGRDAPAPRAAAHLPDAA